MCFSSSPRLPLYAREALYRLPAAGRGSAAPCLPGRAVRPLRLEPLTRPPLPPPGLELGLSAAFSASVGGSSLTAWTQVPFLLHSVVFWPPACPPATLSRPVESEVLWLPPDTSSSLGAFPVPRTDERDGARPRCQNPATPFLSPLCSLGFPQTEETNHHNMKRL